MGENTAEDLSSTKTRSIEKIVIFVEGQTEKIFIKRLIEEIEGYQDLQVASFSLNKKSENIQYLRGNFKPKPNIHKFFLVIDAGGDKKAFKEATDNARITSFTKQGFSKIICIHDLYVARSEKQELLKKTDKALKLKKSIRPRRDSLDLRSI